MANAKQCDRCGKLYTVPKETAIDALSEKFSMIAKSDMKLALDAIALCLDLCPECRVSFEKWFYNKEEEQCVQ